ncbi:DASH complex subunit Dad1-domain-containing protein [Kalaharituber pfeilii]|nr:DASH complex subunit Dad1-domain-containing protein [Kalaharituber pfeilii]
MSTTRKDSDVYGYHQDAPGGSGSGSGGVGERSFFETERARLITEISLSLDQVLQNLNLLNRSLEGVISVGKEFESVEMLWAQFEGVMGSGAGGDVAVAEEGGSGGGSGDNEGEEAEMGEGEGR